MAEELMEFKARKVMSGGKETLVIDPICQEIDRGNGRQDVVIHMPSLGLINRFKAAHGIG